jgi:hypothetical protein
MPRAAWVGHYLPTWKLTQEQRKSPLYSVKEVDLIMRQPDRPWKTRRRGLDEDDLRALWLEQDQDIIRAGGRLAADYKSVPGHDGQNQTIVADRKAKTKKSGEKARAKKAALALLENERNIVHSKTAATEHDSAEFSSSSEGPGSDINVDMGGMEVATGAEDVATSDDVPNGHEIEEVRNGGNWNSVEGARPAEIDDEPSSDKLTKEMMKADLKAWGVPLNGVRNKEPTFELWRNASRSRKAIASDPSIKKPAVSNNVILLVSEKAEELAGEPAVHAAETHQHPKRKRGESELEEARKCPKIPATETPVNETSAEPEALQQDVDAHMGGTGDSVDVRVTPLRKKAPVKKRLASQAAPSKPSGANQTAVKSTAKPTKAVPTKQSMLAVTLKDPRPAISATSAREGLDGQDNHGVSPAFRETKKAVDAKKVSRTRSSQYSMQSNAHQVNETTSATGSTSAENTASAIAVEGDEMDVDITAASKRKREVRNFGPSRYRDPETAAAFPIKNQTVNFLEEISIEIARKCDLDLLNYPEYMMVTRMIADDDRRLAIEQGLLLHVPPKRKTKYKYGQR